MMTRRQFRMALRAFALLATLCFAVAGNAVAQDRPPGADLKIESLEFRDAKLIDAIRIMSELSGVNILATRDASSQKVSLFLSNTTVHSAIDSLARVGGLWYRYNRKSKSYLIMTAAQFQDDLIVFREDYTRIFQMRHQNVESVAQIISNLFGSRVELALNDNGDLLASEFGGGGGSSNSSNRSGGGRFSSSNRNNRFSSSSGGGSGRSGGGRNRTILNNEALSNSQLSLLTQRASLAADGQIARVSEGAIEAIASREPAIYVTVSRLHNLVYVRTSDRQVLEEIARIIKETDRPTPQVLLEMKILELEVGDQFRSIFNLSLQSRSTTTIADAAGNLIAAPSAQLGLGNFALQGGSFLFQFLNDQIQAQLEVLETENRINVLATPMVLASNGTPAKLFIGEERVLTTGAETSTVTGTSGATTTFVNLETEVRDIGITLRIVPRINADRTVTLFIQQDNSTVNPGAANLPIGTDNGKVVLVPIDTVDTANIEGVVTAKDGFTVAIGGLIRKTKRDVEEKVPFLGDIPLIGTLFRRDEEEDSKTELILLITPHIFETPREAEEDSRARLARLSSNTELDSFGFGASSNLNPLQGKASVQDMVRLTRFAAQAMNGEKATAVDIIPQPIDFAGSIQLFVGGGAGVTPLKSWRRGALYVTAARIANRRSSTYALRPTKVVGAWRAVTFERDKLAPTGQPNSDGFGYFVSSRPFMDIVNAIAGAAPKPAVHAGTKP